MKTKVAIVGGEFHVTLEDGSVHEYPVNMTYRAAVLDHCGDNEKMRAAVEAAIGAPDVPAPAPVDNVTDLDAQIAALNARRKAVAPAAKPAAKKPAAKKKK